MGNEPTNLIDLAIGQAIIKTELKNLTTDLAIKHGQNRNDIHNVRDNVQTLSQEVYLMKIKITTYSTVAGVLTALILKVLDHFWK